jgi:hypothetical protein
MTEHVVNVDIFVNAETREEAELLVNDLVENVLTRPYIHQVERGPIESEVG